MKKIDLLRRLSALVLGATIIVSSLIGSSVNSAADGTTNQAAVNYYSRSVFVGDSVMVGFRNYASSHAESNVHFATFLAAKSFSACHALNPASKDSLQPSYQGKKQNVWDSIALMDVDRVFLFFGTNDLVVKNASVTADNIFEVAARIKATKPSVDIIIISMTPVYAGVNKGALNNQSINELNVYLAQRASANGYGYVDINSYMKDENGNLKASYCSDKYVHLNDSAYAVWDSILCTYATSHAK